MKKLSATEIIESHGGAASLARKLGYDTKTGGTQRVFNWRTKGIPAHIYRDHPWVLKIKKEIKNET